MQTYLDIHTLVGSVRFGLAYCWSRVLIEYQRIKQRSEHIDAGLV